MKWGKVVLKFLGNVSLLLVFLLLGILVMWGLGRVFLAVHSEGFFSSWKALDGSRSFERIVDATSQELWAQSGTGQLYYWNSNCRREMECNTWLETQDVPANLHGGPEFEIKREKNCSGFLFLGPPPGEVVECASAFYAGPETGATVLYAFMENGNVWSWSYRASMFLDLAVVFFSVPSGLVLGLITFNNYMLKRKAKSIANTETVL